MKHVNCLFFCGVFTLLFFNIVVCQEKPAKAISKKQKETIEKGSRKTEPKVIFNVFGSPIGSPKRTKTEVPPNNPPIINDLKLDKTELTSKYSVKKQSENFEAEN